jgi:hypothetical protein
VDVRTSVGSGHGKMPWNGANIGLLLHTPTAIVYTCSHSCQGRLRFGVSC